MKTMTLAAAPFKPGLGTRFYCGEIDGPTAMLELAGTFPSVRQHLMGLHSDNWDIDRFMSDFGVLCSGAKQAKLFLAAVWDPAWPAEHGLEFNIVNAMAAWDAAHKHAFIQWCQDPFWP